MITGLSDTQVAVAAMKAGAMDFIEKPFKLKVLKKSLAKALEQSAGGALHNTYLENISNRYKNLTPRQIEVMDLVLAGHPNKNIATTLGISQRTIENHRAAVMVKTDSVSLPALALFAVGLARSMVTNQQPVKALALYFETVVINLKRETNSKSSN
jgi:two-component system, chemotaxis family, CheB/CheR fusion protein